MKQKRRKVEVIARLHPIDNWNGLGLDFQSIQRFLCVVQDHLAMFA
jgi:hypothetical protein